MTMPSLLLLAALLLCGCSGLENKYKICSASNVRLTCEGGGYHIVDAREELKMAKQKNPQEHFWLKQCWMNCSNTETIALPKGLSIEGKVQE